METTRTFKQWSQLGYRIVKGSKATWKDGVAHFSFDQVERPPWYNGQRQYERNYHEGGYYNTERYGDHREVMEPPAQVSAYRSNVMGASAIRAEQEAQARWESRGYGSSTCNCGVGWGCGCGTAPRRERRWCPTFGYADDGDEGEVLWDEYWS